MDERGRWPREHPGRPAIKPRAIRHQFVTIGIGLVGCGRWGLNYLRAFSELDGCRVVAACDVSPDRLREAAQKVTDRLKELCGIAAIEGAVKKLG